MTIQQLEHFVEVCRCGSIVLAANHCFISPAGMRLSLHRIEDELGCKLLRKSSNGVIPTEEGKAFYKSALEITKKYSECTQEIAEIHRDYELIHVAVGDHFPNLFVTSVLAAFNKSKKNTRWITGTIMILTLQY